MKHPFLMISILLFTFQSCSTHNDTESESPQQDTARWSPITITGNLDPQSFKTIPAGNYSGITPLGNNRYAVVTDQSTHDGFYIFDLSIDPATGKITDAQNEGYISNSDNDRDNEGIVYVPSTNTIMISSENENQIVEYTIAGARTGRSFNIPAVFQTASSTYGFESLAYSSITHTFWTTTESTLSTDGIQADPTNKVCNQLRIQSFGEGLQPLQQYAYQMDMPKSTTSAYIYAMGVSDILALDDGRLIILEREFYVPENKWGAFVCCKLYLVNPQVSIPVSTSVPLSAASPFMSKTLLTEINTTLSSGIANYEGICLGPKLANGDRTLILCSDSQNQYYGILQDYFKVITFR